jgi:NAD(P)-dependent dehydrogenase (short-subunit alcohol dehydrogenase family)
MAALAFGRGYLAVPPVGSREMQVKGAGALVAGGASGLGAATARVLAAAGASVAIVDLNAEKGEALAGELGPEASFVEADVTDEAAVSAAVERAAAVEGGLRVSVCCAGIGWAERVAHKGGPHNLEFFSNVVKVNLIGSFNVLRLAAAAMSENEPDTEGERGVCVNTASIAAYDGQIGQAAYAASKGGIVGLTLPAARDMASRGVRVVTIAPGLFDTPLLAALPEDAREALGAGIPFPSRLGRPEEYAELVGQIVANSMLNGETIRLDGALRMPPK